MPRSLDSDIAYFDAHFDAIRSEGEARGKTAVLIFDREVVDYYDSVVDAANAGYEKFGGEVFLARSVTIEIHQPALASILAVQ